MDCRLVILLMPWPIALYSHIRIRFGSTIDFNLLVCFCFIILHCITDQALHITNEALMLIHCYCIELKDGRVPEGIS